MSNYMAIATVTAALQQLLQDPVKQAVTGANVGFSRPEPEEHGKGGPLVNIYLYQVTPNSAYRNADLPTRRPDGTLVNRPLAALDLHYLLTFHGDDDKLEPQLMLGAVASTLQSQPMLSPGNIQAALSSPPFNTLLKYSDLANQVERVRFTPTALSLEEFSKLWSVFFQVEYSLSAAYQASVVLIESEDVPQEALPVRSRQIYVTPFRQPNITRVIAQAGANQPIIPTSTLLVQGTQLLGGATMVRMGNLLVVPSSVSDKVIYASIPDGLPAGVLGLQVLQQVLLGTPPGPHSGFESNIVPFVLQPVIKPTTVTDTQITVQVAPNVQPGQRASLLLNQMNAAAGATPAAYRFTLPPIPAVTNSLTFDLTGVQGGGATYFIRLTLDGAESPLDLDSSSANFGPTVALP